MIAASTAEYCVNIDVKTANAPQQLSRVRPYGLNIKTVWTDLLNPGENKSEFSKKKNAV